MPGFRPPNRIEIAYRRAITDALAELLGLIPPDLSEGEWLTQLAALGYRPEMLDLAARTAYKMVEWINIDNAKSWRAASRQSQRSQRLFRLLQHELAGPVGVTLNWLVRENAKLISSIPSTVASMLTGEIATAAQGGARHETMTRMMRVRFPELTHNRIALIARTETAKASTALTRARSEELDLTWFVWKTSEDRRVRPAHKNLNGVLVSWADLPQPEALIGEKSTLGKGAAGDFPNCRCYPAPLLSLDDVFANGSVRARVYHNDHIERMTRAQFARLSGVERRYAA
jgi:SPP1 gp7 family putative phage head morphogenesis protein